MSQIFGFGWSLFLVSKGKLLSDPPDLLDAFHVLLCCINLLYVHTPANLKRISLSDGTSFVALTLHADDNHCGISSLKRLCLMYSAVYTDVLKVHEQLFMPFLLMVTLNSLCTYFL